MILKKYDYFRIENVMFMMDNYNINTVYEKYMQLNKKERKRLLDSLHIHGIDIKKIEPYVYSEAPGIKHLFFYFRGRKEAVPYYLLEENIWRTIQVCIMNFFN